MLRRLNRLSNFRNRLLRERFYSSRTKVEAHFLQLQNLKSEIRHLQKTISTCLEFQLIYIYIYIKHLIIIIIFLNNKNFKCKK